MRLQTISVEVSTRAVATVRLNRPDRGNAFDQRMLDERAYPVTINQLNGLNGEMGAGVATGAARRARGGAPRS